MAKVRVYELAKELNMDSKKLLEKLNAGGMQVNNHMSTLDEKSVIRARDIVSGAVSEVVEEKRIKPTVIRRRKKLIKVQKKPPEEAAEEKPEPEVTEPAPEQAAAEEKTPVQEMPSRQGVTESKPVPTRGQKEPPPVSPAPRFPSP